MLTERVIQCPFAWYKKEAYQERYSLGCLNDCTPFLYAPQNRLLPFQIRVGKKSITPTFIYDVGVGLDCDTNMLDLTNNLGHFSVIESEGYEYIIYKGDNPLDFRQSEGAPLESLALPDGLYTARISTNKGIFYSEVFCPKSDLELTAFYKLEWWAGCDFGDTVYTTGYKNRCYLDAVPQPPKVELEQDEDKDGYGRPYPTLQRFIYKHTLTIPDALHSLVMAVCTIPLHPENLLELPDGRSTKMEFVKAGPDFRDCKAELALEFSESVILQTACCQGDETGLNVGGGGGIGGGGSLPGEGTGGGVGDGSGGGPGPILP